MIWDDIFAFPVYVFLFFFLFSLSMEQIEHKYELGLHSQKPQVFYTDPLHRNSEVTVFFDLS